MPRSSEYPPLHELPEALLKRYTERFIHRHDCYPIQLDQGNYVTLKRPLTLGLLQAHFKGLLTLGAYALNEQSLAHWVCLDADQMEQWQGLVHLSQILALEGISSYLEPSRRGGHLWFFTAAISGQKARLFGQGLLSKYGLDLLEIYPKQALLKTGVGSLVRLPLGIHRKSGKRYHFIQPSGEPLAPTIRQQMALLARPSLVPPDFVDKICAEIPEKSSAPVALQPIKVPRDRLLYDSKAPVSERLKQAVSVWEFVSRYVALDAHGKGLCPFHDDQQVSFQVNAEQNYWSCYAGCGGGSIIDFWMKWREHHGQDGSFTTTIKDLANFVL